MQKAREEQAVFQDLDMLCRSPGYVHAIAYFCFRDNLVLYQGNLRPEDMQNLYGDKRLVRTEIATLIGLLVKQPIDDSLPRPEQMQGYIDQTEALLHELHVALAAAWTADFKPGDDFARIREGMMSARGLREPIFYGGESAYSFQYRDLAREKYAPDETWLLANKGFQIADAVAVAQALGPLQSKKQAAAHNAFRGAGAGAVTFLPGFIFELDEIAAAAGLDRRLVETILAAFTLPASPANATFDTLSAFNAANATPLIRLGDGRWLLLQFYTLLEAIYEAPFFWMMADKAYRATHSAHRGAFTEGFAATRLAKVFGEGRVIRNVDIWRGKDRLGEIDVLVMFGDRAVVLQAKSKRLTIEARKGNDMALQNDFKGAVQDAVDQALLCSECLLAPADLVFTSDGAPVDIGGPFRGVYPLCVVSDHYPALAYQARHFLKPKERSKAILTPLVIDVFALDAMTEMLERPLQLINYFSLRAMFGDRLMFTHELTLLGYHLQGNLWVENANDMLALGDDISTIIDAAMMVRREGLPGDRTPDGILTRLIIEALTNLLRAGWIEIRVSDSGAIFNTTAAGTRRASEKELPVQLHSEQRWTSLCFDCLTGSWLRSDDLELVHINDLPYEAEVLDSTLFSFDPREVPRELFRLNSDEGLDPVEPAFRTPSKHFARVSVSFEQIQGLPHYASLALKAEITARATLDDAAPEQEKQLPIFEDENEVTSELSFEDIFVGGEEHRTMLEHVLETAKTCVVIHSCFLHPEVIQGLAPFFERAAKRKVRVELIWGLNYDPETPEKRKPITDSEKIIAGLPQAVRNKVQLSTLSSRSHGKFIIYDDKESGLWKTVIGSCNFLSSWFDSIDISVRTQSQFLAMQLLARLIATQQPAAAGWPPMTIRLNNLWSQIKRSKECAPNNAPYRLRLIADMEHHACVTQARDEAVSSADPLPISIGCDLYGISAETSVLTPAGRAAELGNPVTIFFQRPSKFLSEEGRRPDAEGAAARGMQLLQTPKLHGKFLLWGDDSAVITSFNWLSTALDGARSLNAEFGLRIQGGGIAKLIRKKLSAAGLRFPEDDDALGKQLELIPLDD